MKQVASRATRARAKKTAEAARAADDTTRKRTSKASKRATAEARPDHASESPIRLPGKLEHWPIDRLRPYERNPRTHSPEQITKIAASLLEFGWTVLTLSIEEDSTRSISISSMCCLASSTV